MTSLELKQGDIVTSLWPKTSDMNNDAIDPCRGQITKSDKASQLGIKVNSILISLIKFINTMPSYSAGMKKHT